MFVTLRLLRESVSISFGGSLLSVNMHAYCHEGYKLRAATTVYKHNSYVLYKIVPVQGHEQHIPSSIKQSEVQSE